MVTKRFPKPPPFSTPREAPWIEVEQIKDGINLVAAKLDEVIAAIRAAPTPAAPPQISPTDALVTRIDALIEQLDAFIRYVPITGGAPADGRVDAIVKFTKNRPGWNHDHKNVATPGIAEQLSDMAVPDGFNLVVRAKPLNKGYIYAGKSTPDATRTGSRITLLAGQPIKLRVTNASFVFVDASVSGEGVEYFTEKA